VLVLGEVVNEHVLRQLGLVLLVFSFLLDSPARDWREGQIFLQLVFVVKPFKLDVKVIVFQLVLSELEIVVLISIILPGRPLGVTYGNGFWLLLWSLLDFVFFQRLVLNAEVG